MKKSRDRAFLYSCVFIGISWIVAVVSRIKFNGLIFGFDYGIYQPDGVHYTFRSLVFQGVDMNEAAIRVADWYQRNSFKLNDIDPSGILPQNNGAWGLVKPRVLYPILSVPFVFLLGIPGMLVVPCLALLILMIYPLSFGRDRRTLVLACLLSFSLSLSPTVMRWMVANCTDSLLAGLFCLYLWVSGAKRVGNRNYVLIAVLAILTTSMTRFCLPFWLALAIGSFLRREILKGILITGLSVICSLPAILSTGTSGVSPAVTNAGILTKIAAVPINFIKVSCIEFLELAALDRLLLFLLCLSVVIAIKSSNKRESQDFLLMLLAGLFVGALNGTLGVNFRYQLPVLAYLVPVILNTDFTTRSTVSNMKSRIFDHKPAQPKNSQK